jgi:hypothetical protein
MHGTTSSYTLQKDPLIFIQYFELWKIILIFFPILNFLRGVNFQSSQLSKIAKLFICVYCLSFAYLLRSNFV